MLAVVLLTLTAGQPVVTDAPASQWTFSAEYIWWWIRRAHVPAVVTTSPAASQGVLGRPDTTIVYGDEWLQTRHHDQFIGTRFAGQWTHASGLFGLEGRAFFLERDSTYFTLKHRPDPLLALSYVDGRTGQETSEIVAGHDPRRGDLDGGFVGYSRVEWYGQEANVVVPLFDEATWSLDGLVGARFFQMRDRYHHTATSYVLPEKSQLYGVIDNIRVGNTFYGGQLGLKGEARWSRLFVQGRVAVALGADDQLLRTWGQRIDHNPASRIQTSSGLFIQPSNAGRFTRVHLDAAGEVAVNVGYQVTDWLSGYVGYTFLYWADPLRAASQVDRVVNPDQPASRPANPWKGDALWVQGWNVGLQARW